MRRNIYTVDKFNTKNAPEAMVQYVLDTVKDFGHRYSMANRIIGMEKCPLSRADWLFFHDISDAIYDWCVDNDKNPDQYDIEEIFG